MERNLHAALEQKGLNIHIAERLNLIVCTNVLKSVHSAERTWSNS